MSKYKRVRKLVCLGFVFACLYNFNCYAGMDFRKMAGSPSRYYAIYFNIQSLRKMVENIEGTRKDRMDWADRLMSLCEGDDELEEVAGDVMFEISDPGIGTLYSRIKSRSALKPLDKLEELVLERIPGAYVNVGAIPIGTP